MKASLRRCLPLTASMLTLSLALGACGSDKPTRLYVLSSMTQAPAGTPATNAAIGVGPVTLPKYLDRPQIVTRISDNSLAQSDLDQWGGDLNDNITRVVASNLSRLLGTERVSLYPWKDQAPVTYQVSIDIIKFEKEPDGSTVLSAFWSLASPSDGSVKLMQQSTYRDAGAAAAAGGNPYDGTVAAMSRDLEALSKDIAKAIVAQGGS